MANMISRWMKRKDNTTDEKSRFYPITHSTSVISGDTTVENRLNETGMVKGAGTGAVESVNGGCSASGIASFAVGKGNQALDFNTVFGKYAKTQNKGYETNTNGDAFIVGNGVTNESRSNCFRGTYQGQLFAMKAFTTGGADYAEYFEWKDGNPHNDDRRGLFVTLDGEKTVLSDDKSTYILGVVSANPSVIGNNDDDWNGRWLRDEFGAFLYECGNLIENPEYEPSRPYIPRESRKEWDLIGLVGVLVVSDDGTCKVNGFCKPGIGGVATAAVSGFRVIKRINGNLIKVVL